MHFHCTSSHIIIELEFAKHTHNLHLLTAHQSRLSQPQSKPTNTSGTLLLLRRVLNKLNPLLNVPLKPLHTSLNKLLLILIRRAQDIDSFLCTIFTQFNRDAEVIAARLLLDLVAAGDAGKVDEGGFYDAGFAFYGLHYALCEAEAGVGHAEGGGAGAVFGFDDFVAAELDA